jgi:hypothetical protein
VVQRHVLQELQLELDAASGTLAVLGAGSAPATSSGSDWAQGLVNSPGCGW